MSVHDKNKIIVKNTLALYFRQIITMVISLYTARIVLQMLGVTDYGINNVVGGVVSMLSFLTGSLSGATQRFLSVELGKTDFVKLKRIFANSLSLHLIFILLAVILAETVGLWFLESKLVIPPERANAAFWVYQFSVISFSISVFFAPFDGALRAREKFDFYAKMSIFDVVMRLFTVYLLVILPHDKLIALSFMGMIVRIMDRMIVYFYCYKNLKECRVTLSWTKDIIRQIFGYNAYSIIGSAAFIIRFQGLNMVLNLYYGPVLNAAQEIANRIYAAISSFSDNAALATQPQIIMSYTQNDKQRLWNLITTSSRLYFYLLLILTLPFILEIDAVLYMWLGNYPEYTAVFTQIFLIEALSRVLGHPIAFANSATGKLRATTVNTIIFRLIILFFAIFIGINKLSPIYIYVFMLLTQGLSLIITMIIVLKYQLEVSLYKYFTDVILPITKTSLFVISLPAIAHYFLVKSILSSCAVGIFTLIWSAIIVLYIGLNYNEKQMVADRMPLLLRNVFFPKR